ncbi:MAG: hypothetical protein WCR58_00280 [Bacteroidales bacterium]|jgi:rod shape-determining protein MreD|nr:hypothetical protein [Bacteroidales bacterium]MCK9448569.1 hypothetical protein [Bacteroidales bacterium]MDD3700045.1 hypothetical protein [Bacteroidales bacterium]MDY0368817.1 hypothetical protein [Bacteroidales bacterium]
MNKTLIQIARLTGLLLLQVWVINNIRLGGYVNPFVYVLFIMMLPIAVPGWLLLISAFGVGMIMDIFMSTAGLHSAALLLMAFTRPAVIRLITGSSIPENISYPSISQMGDRGWISYTLVMVLIYHGSLFLLESFSFQQIEYTFLRIILSSIASAIIILLLSYLFVNRSAKGLFP